MRKLMLTTALCLAATTAQARHSNPFLASSMVSVCEAASGAYHPSDPDHFREGFCMGVIEGAAVMAAGDGTICIPDNVTNEQSMLIVIKWMRDNPRFLNEQFSMIAAVALHQAYPCSGDDTNHDVGEPQKLAALSLARSLPSSPERRSGRRSSASSRLQIDSGRAGGYPVASCLSTLTDRT